MFLSHHRAVIPFPPPHCMISLIEQVCIAMVPGGCVIKHPDAKLEAGASSERDGGLWIFEDSAVVGFNHLKFTFWMHNARGFKNTAFFYDKDDHSEEPVFLRKHLVDEAVEYFKKLWSDQKFQKFHPSLVFSHLSVLCCTLASCFTHVLNPLPYPLSVGGSPVRPHWRQVDRRPERPDFFRCVDR